MRASSVLSFCPSIRLSPWWCRNSMEYRNGLPLPGRPRQGLTAPSPNEIPDVRLQYLDKGVRQLGTQSLSQFAGEPVQGRIEGTALEQSVAPLADRRPSMPSVSSPATMSSKAVANSRRRRESVSCRSSSIDRSALTTKSAICRSSREAIRHRLFSCTSATATSRFSSMARRTTPKTWPPTPPRIPAFTSSAT